MTVEKIAYSIEEAAQAVSLGRSSINEEIRANRLRAVNVGRRTIMAADDLQAWLVTMSTQSRQTPS